MPSTNGDENNVRVVVRCRPLLDELERNEDNVIQIDDSIIRVASRQFTFDHVFGPECIQKEVYSRAGAHIVDAVLQGYNGTIFAYGQTGTGKTYTSCGIMEHSFQHIFEHISSSGGDHKFLVRASFYEIYNEEIHDLLAQKGQQKSLKLKETKGGQVTIKDLSSFVVNNVQDLKKLSQIGEKQRAFGATKMNQRSSRSHTIFTITIETVVGVSGNVEIHESTSGQCQNAYRVGKFHLIDLAGSERQNKTGTSGARLKEASNINLSLTSLSLVIAALTDSKAKFVPYRNSKLTRILSDSLGGNSKTLLIACIGPAKMNQDETLSTLRFACLTKNIKNRPVINEDSKDALMRKFQEQIRDLKNQLENEDGGEIDELAENKKVIPPELLEKLKALENKMLIGGENLIEKAEAQERAIIESELELQERRANERQLQAELEQRNAEILEMEDSYASLQEEVAAVNRKLRKAYGFLKESRAELEDMSVEHERLRAELLDSVRTAEKEIKLTNGLIRFYVPDKELERIEENSIYNQMTGDWELKCIAYTGNNMKADFDLHENEHNINDDNNNVNDDDIETEFDNNFNSNKIFIDSLSKRNLNRRKNEDLFTNIYLSYSSLNLV